MKKMTALLLFLLVSITIVSFMLPNRARPLTTGTNVSSTQQTEIGNNYIRLSNAGIAIHISSQPSAYTAGFLKGFEISDSHMHHTILDLQQLEHSVNPHFEIGDQLTLNYENTIYNYEIYESSVQNVENMQPAENVLSVLTADNTVSARLISVR